MRKQNKKVILVAYEKIPSPAGLSCWLAQEIKILTKHYDLDVLSLKSEDLSHIERFHGARLLRVPVGGGDFLDRIKTFQRAIRRQLESEDYALCHFSSIWGGLALAARKPEAAYKLVYEVQSLPSIDFKVLHPDQASRVETSFPLKQQEDRCLAAADRVIAGSELIKQHLIGRGVAAESISLVRPGIELDQFDNVADLPRLPGTILYLGSLAPWQGVPSLIKAVAELPHGLPLRLHIVCPADDPFRKTVLGKIQMLGMARKVELVDTPPVEQIPALVARADVCVMPSSNHAHNRMAASTPLKLLVYMACRRAVVAARQPVVCEIVEDGVQAALYRPGDIKALSATLKKLLLDRDLCVRLGNQARLRLEEVAPLANAKQALRNVYRELLGGRPASDSDAAGPELAAEIDTDTQPSILEGAAADRLADDLDTNPSAGKLYANSSNVTEDTVTLPLKDGQPLENRQPEPPPPPMPDTDPEGQPFPAQDDLVFKSVDDEDTAPRRNLDNWQVMELSGVELPSEDDRTATEDKGRWLLGGPPFPVGTDNEGLGEDSNKLPTQRVDSATPENLQMLSDSDVKLIDNDQEDSSPKEPPTDPNHKK